MSWLLVAKLFGSACALFLPTVLALFAVKTLKSGGWWGAYFLGVALAWATLAAYFMHLVWE